MSPTQEQRLYLLYVGINTSLTAVKGGEESPAVIIDRGSDCAKEKKASLDDLTHLCCVE